MIRIGRGLLAALGLALGTVAALVPAPVPAAGETPGATVAAEDTEKPVPPAGVRPDAEPEVPDPEVPDPGDAALPGAVPPGPVLSPSDTAQRLPPLEEMVSSPFGRRRLPGWRSRRGLVMRHHNGVDLRARLDWPVIAFKGGTVTLAGRLGNSGLVVEVRQEDGLSARYAHLGSILVSKGQKVNPGDQLGGVGCTGRTTGAHLHFGLKNAKGAFIDPLPHLRGAEQLLAPAPDQIPAVLTPQQCRPRLKIPARQK